MEAEGATPATSGGRSGADGFRTPVQHGVDGGRGVAHSKMMVDSCVGGRGGGGGGDGDRQSIG